MEHTYTAVLIPEEEGIYSARIGSIPGLVVEGFSYSHALQNLEDALDHMIEDYHSHGIPLPADDKGRNARLPFGARLERVTVGESRLRRLLDEYRDEADDWY